MFEKTKAVVTIPVNIVHREEVTIEVECDHDADPLDLIDERMVMDKLPYSEKQYRENDEEIEIQWDDADYNFEDDEE